MGRKLERRRRLFYKFSNQLHLMVDEGLLRTELKYESTYICPICLNQFKESELVTSNNANFLTEEDAPPAKLKGKRVALTCKDCNSNAGHQIDNHLINRIREIDDSKFYKGSKQFRILKHEGENITSEITSNGEGTLTVLHRIAKNNPNLLDRFIYGLRNRTVGPILNLEPRDYKVTQERVNIALAITNYILTFSKFGYLFLLHPYYDTLRKAILKPEQGDFRHIFLQDQFNRERIGTYFVVNPNSRAIFNIFSLRTLFSETLIGAILPMPSNTPEQLYNRLINNGNAIEGQEAVSVNMQTEIIDPNDDLFHNIDDMKKIMAWALG